MAKKALLKINVNPRSSKNELTRWTNDVLYIKITAPPVDGAANAAVAKFLTSQLGIKKNAARLVCGEKSREKIFEIDGLTLDEIHSILDIGK